MTGRTSWASNAIDRAFLATLAVLSLYYVYRYPLQVHVRGSGSDYSNTPIELQIGKYLLLGGIAAFGLMFSLREVSAWRARLDPANLVLAALSVFAFVRATVSLAVTGSFTTFDLVGPLICVVPVILLMSIGLVNSHRAEALGRACLVLAAALLVVHAAANAVQISLWQGTGRLPALGYEGLIPRFGGFWDDPNSCAVYSAAVLVVFASRWTSTTRRIRLLVTACALFNLLFAWSYSGWLLLMVGLSVLALLQMRRTVHRAAIVIAVVASLAAGLFVVPRLDSIAEGFPVVGDSLALSLEAKEESFTQRLHLNVYIERPKDAASWVVGSNRPNQIESGIGNWFAATGLVGTAILLAWLWLSFRAIAGTADATWVFPVGAGLLGASFFVPFLVIFPVAGLFALAVALPASYRTKLAMERLP